MLYFSILPALIPSDPQQRSQVQMWQAWEQLMHTDHIYPLMETTLLPSMFKHRFVNQRVKSIFTTYFACLLTFFHSNNYWLAQDCYTLDF